MSWIKNKINIDFQSVCPSQNLFKIESDTPKKKVLASRAVINN